MQRDRSFLGLHAPLSSSSAPKHLDLYGTLACLEWRAPRKWLLRELEKARNTFLRVFPQHPAGKVTLPRTPSLNPEAWTVGHVAFTFDMLISDPLGLPKQGELTYLRSSTIAGHKGNPKPSSLPRARAWTLYDSMRVSGNARWQLALSGELPDATSYLAAVHEEARSLILSAEDDEGDGSLVRLSRESSSSSSRPQSRWEQCLCTK